METFQMPVQIRWADLDPNFHLRHSVYYDFGAMCRMEFLNSIGLTWRRLAEIQKGPILFREECIFRREIRLHDPVTIDMKLIRAKRNFSRFTIEHTIKKNPETVSAILTVDIAWIDGVARKLTVLPQEDIDKLVKASDQEGVEWLD